MRSLTHSHCKCVYLIKCMCNIFLRFLYLYSHTHKLIFYIKHLIYLI